MIKLIYSLIFVAFVASAASVEEFVDDGYDPEEVHTVYSPDEQEIHHYRLRRSLQPGAPQFPGAPSQNGGWAVSPNVEKDASGNTRTAVEVQHKGDNHDFNAGWSKVVRGPAKAKPTFHVGGTYRWKRSLQPGAPQFPGAPSQNGGWAVSPNVEKDASGNTRTAVEVQHKGDNHDFNAGWSKVVRGPAKAKPTFHVGGTYRWRRSIESDQPQVNYLNEHEKWSVHSEPEENNSENDFEVPKEDMVLGSIMGSFQR